MSFADCDRLIDEFPERLLIGEIYLPLDRLGSLLRQRSWRSASAIQFFAAGNAMARA